MISNDELKAVIAEHEKAKLQYQAEGQADINARQAVIQQANDELRKKVVEYQVSINRQEGAIDQLKKLLEPEKASEVKK